MTAMPLPGYVTFVHSDPAGETKTVYRGGEGPPVIILHELAGISPMLVEFAGRVQARGFSTYLPVLIPRRRGPVPVLRAALQICLSGEFVKLARGKTSPVVGWLRSLAQRLHDETGSPVGVVGMCLTGGFALAMAVDDHVVGPVAGHPSLPLAIGSRRQYDIGLDPGDLATLKERSDLRVLGVRFSGDWFVPKGRFDRMRDEFGDRFTTCEIVSGPRSPNELPWWEHSVLNNRRIQSASPEETPARAAIEDAVDTVLNFIASEFGRGPESGVETGSRDGPS